MAKWSSVFLSAVLFIQPFSEVAQAVGCDAYFLNLSEETAVFFGQPISYQRVTSQDLSYKEGYKEGRLPTNKISRPNAVYLGLDSVGHLYMVAGDYRYDGGGILEPSRLKKRDNVMLSEGFVVALEDEDGSLQKSIVAELEKNGMPKSLTCVSGICTVVNRSQSFTMNEEKLKGYDPMNFLKQLLQADLRDAQGKKIKQSYYLVGDKSFDDSMEQARRGIAYGRSNFGNHASGYAVAAVAIFIAGAGITHVLLSNL